ncbi:hypothetical protein PENTCL1PPCAC_24860 [Pristionchus entomophagus]|uniref:Uncharacterized protein n=1 Tax=Pristionchus entomophagus TaxID=358040 RepID=A0AAV5U721_9BILA|nr:hypothetical protein PENTCL1PPCAC_24860 [Pristionchus entomophagus]
MPLRSKSVPPKKNRSPPPEEHDNHSEYGEEVEVLPAEHGEKKKKKTGRKQTSKKRAGSASRKHSSIADRPEWNNDTHIDGYDDLDENGKVKRQGVMHTLNGEKSKKQQEELNKAWSESLRN